MYNRIISFLFKFFFLSLFLGISYMIFIYTQANYEDKDLTKTFIKNNKDKLSHIYSIESYRNPYYDYPPSIDVIVKTSFFKDLKNFQLTSKECKFTIFINSNNVKFLEDDILKYGKENMYLKAEKCLDDVLKYIEEDNFRKEKEKQLKEKEKLDRIQKLNEKFNENEIYKELK